MSLCFVALFDEIWSGVPVCGAPSVERELGISHAGYAGAVFAAPLLLAALIEAGCAVLSDALDRRRLLVAAQGALALALTSAACATRAWQLSASLALAGAASGVACGAAQALLLSTDDRGADRALVRWTLFASLGDVCAPLITACAVAAGLSYRAAMAAVALLVAIQCGASIRTVRGAPPARSATPADAAAEPASAPLLEALRRAARRPRLWAWLSVAAMCTLLDELVVALCALRMEREQAMGAALATASGVAFAIGSTVGAALTDGAVARLGARRVLVVSAVACSLAIGLLLRAEGAAATGVAMFVLGATASPHHPLAHARAYDEMPDRPGIVQACTQIFVCVDLIAPLGLGYVATRSGLGAALACLLLQPFAVLLAAAGLREAGRTRTAP